MTPRRIAPLFEPAPWAVLRTPLLPAAACEDSNTSSAVADPQVRRALAIGAPNLLDALDRSSTRDKALERAHASLTRYLKRMSTRPTPYGAFAAVSLIRWADTTTAQIAAPDTLRTRPDMGWLLGLLSLLDSDPSDRAHAIWSTNPLLMERDERYAVLGETFSVRASGAARAAVTAAREPLSYGHLCDMIASQTGGTQTQIDELLTALWSMRILRTDLQPKLTGPDPIGHIIELVRRTRPDTADALTRLVKQMHELDAARATDAPRQLAGLRREASAIHPADGPVMQTDMRRDLGPGTLSAEVARELARAAELLFTLTSAPQGSDGLLTFRSRFEHRYGQQTQVRLIDALDPIDGVGPAAHDHGGNDPDQQRHADALMSLAVTALRDGAREIELDETLVERLRTCTPLPENTPVSVELSAFVIACSRAELDEGDFQVLIGPNLGAPEAGRSFGRFADMFGDDASTAFAQLDEAERHADPSMIPVEVVYTPQYPRSANVAVRPTTTTREIVVDCRAGVADSNVLEWGDLHVTIRKGRVVVCSATLNQDIRPTAHHMLNAHGAPPICQFLDDVSRSGTAAFNSFSWGPAESLPALPRVRSGRVILTPARWLLPAELTMSDNGQAIDSSTFQTAVAEWRRKWDIPQRVYLTAGDNRLLLDLSRGADVAQLRREAIKHPAPVRLEEAIPDLGHAWLPGTGGGYLAEVVVPLVRRAVPPHAPAARQTISVQTDVMAPSEPLSGASRPHLVGSAAARCTLPGGEWLFVKLYGPRETENELLTGALADLCDMTDLSGLSDCWFFIRYSDPDPHLRIRWHGEPDVLLRHVLPQIADIAETRRQDGDLSRFTIDTYDRELARYGGPRGLDVCERIFHADSRAVTKLLTLPVDPSNRVIAAAATVDAFVDAFGLDRDARLAFYRQQARLGGDSAHKRAGDLYRDRKHALQAAVLDNGRGDLHKDGGIESALGVLRDGVHEAAHDLHQLDRAAQLSCAPRDLLPSLIHMHVNRINGGLLEFDELLVFGVLERTLRSAAQRAIPH